MSKAKPSKRQQLETVAAKNGQFLTETCKMNWDVLGAYSTKELAYARGDKEKNNYAHIRIDGYPVDI